MLYKADRRAAPLQELQHLSEAPNMQPMSMRPSCVCNALGCQEASDLVAQAKRELNQKASRTAMRFWMISEDRSP
jgi:hypothetical protein